MSWLARLKKLESALPDTLQNLQKGTFVGFVGADPESFQNSSRPIPVFANSYPDPANDANPPAATDNFPTRLALFVNRGLSLDDAEDVAHRLALRDSQRDDRRLCLECQYLSGTINARRCSQWRKIGIGSAAIPADLVITLQRCAGFTHGFKMRM